MNGAKLRALGLGLIVLGAVSGSAKAQYEGIAGLKVARAEDTVDAASTPPPEGAIVLFDGRTLEEWTSLDGSPARWKLVEGGAMEVSGGGIKSKRLISGPVHLHVEFRCPYEPNDRGQARGNSGVYLQGRYEVQVLDSYGIESGDTDCGAIYEVAKPRVNACKAPTVWQTYEIDFWPPEFRDGQKVRPARITVVHNGVTIHQDQEIPVDNTRAGLGGDPSTPGPIHLQDHGDPVQYRNIWMIEKPSPRAG
ncbi:MAG: hypothetical protein KatS3mg108_0883 [Isosphaeraceae bacterium]|jgi:hypothetical protein|nr:MAG: hypothetical protein KatS3mg108_0883 [Isosphaeraceae bacterium]